MAETTPTEQTPAPAVISGPAVSVVSRTRAATKRRAVSIGFFITGITCLTLENSLPGIEKLHPDWKWVPMALAVVGAFWTVVQRITDIWKVTDTNLTEPAPEVKEQ